MAFGLRSNYQTKSFLRFRFFATRRHHVVPILLLEGGPLCSLCRNLESELEQVIGSNDSEYSLKTVNINSLVPPPSSDLTPSQLIRWRKLYKEHIPILFIRDVENGKWIEILRHRWNETKWNEAVSNWQHQIRQQSTTGDGTTNIGSGPS
jgi:hypothetical protein